VLNFKNTNYFTVFASLCFLALIVQDIISAWWMLVLFSGYLITIIIGTFNIRLNFFLTAKHHNCTTINNEIALTFDDGPHPEFTLKVLSLLNKYNAKATFFCIGKNIEKYPKIIDQIINEGHLLGNHSYSHTYNFGFFTVKKAIEDIEKTQKILKNITNKENKLFRPPFGVTNPNISRTVKELNLQTFGWNIRSYDTIAKNPQKVIQKINSKLKKGSIVLLHDTSNLSCLVLEQLLQILDENKIKSVTLNQLFNNKSNAN
jgi:peptidoglycan/xylan/chitin deacetylase (PgdA/CDA1 family)